MNDFGVQTHSPGRVHKGTPPAVQAPVTTPTGHLQDYAGRSFHFLEKPPEGLVCAVCQTVAYDPVQATCCGKIYCTRCIEAWKTKSNSCPTCRSTERSDPPFNVFRDRNALQRITSHVVYCPNWKAGCNKKMELSEVEKHIKSVNCVMLKQAECEYKWFGCSVALPKKDMEGHLQSSVQDHLRMASRRVAEIETNVIELEAQIKKNTEHQRLQAHLDEMEKKAEAERAERQRLQAHLEVMEKKAKAERAENQRLQARLEVMEKKAEAERAEHQLMKVKVEEMNTVIARLEARQDSRI